MTSADEIDWVALAAEVGSIAPTRERWNDEGGMGIHESMGTDMAQKGLERIIGTENIRKAVDLFLDLEPGGAFAGGVLRYIHSSQALDMAYAEYKRGDPDRAPMAVLLIKNLCHPRAIEWVSDFLEDDTVAGWGIGVLDQLLWTHTVEWEHPLVQPLMTRAEAHHNENVREQAAFIREYITDRQDAYNYAASKLDKGRSDAPR